LLEEGARFEQVTFLVSIFMQEGASGWMSRISHVIHLLAGGFWLGALDCPADAQFQKFRQS
jgi:hypothetical protein